MLCPMQSLLIFSPPTTAPLNPSLQFPFPGFHVHFKYRVNSHPQSNITVALIIDASANCHGSKDGRKISSLVKRGNRGKSRKASNGKLCWS